MRIWLCAVLMAGAALPALAQVEGPARPTDTVQTERSERAGELDDVTRAMEEAREAESVLAAEIEAIGEDRAALNRRLIETARRISEAEAGMARAEQRIAGLGDREETVRESLQGRSALLAELLAALQRMGRRPPPAVLVSPEDALRTVRSAIVLGAVLPGLRNETEALAADLGELVRLREEIGRERSRLAADTRRLGAEQRRVEALAEARRRAQESTEEEMAGVRRRAEELARQASGLEELIASLDREIAVSERETAAARPAPSRREALEARENPARLEPAMPFAQARGLLAMPANGAVIRRFGAPDEFDAAARGISIATRSGAQVIAPSDGWVVYAGAFRSYGELLILNAGDGYHVLLAGMGTIAVELGQFVLAGEPVGSMSGQALASTEIVTVEQRQPILYVEFRKDGESIDPAPWWADGRTGVGG